jgi:hypothetical protein
MSLKHHYAFHYSRINPSGTESQENRGSSLQQSLTPLTAKLIPELVENLMKGAEKEQAT